MGGDFDEFADLAHGLLELFQVRFVFEVFDEFDRPHVREALH
ncbi:hypothetical protein [Nocardiopsis kunsanensis]|nr:hypothetical protein [Nocardiopsis kunsanensis]